MQEFINQIVACVQDMMMSLPLVVAVMLGMIVIILESMLPMLPLAVFITLNIFVFGNVVGFAISWIATIIGCIIMFLAVRSLFRDYFREKIKRNHKFKKFMKRIDKMEFTNLVLITALPFTPAFMVNIACGLSKMSKRKFVINLLISKFFMVYFWAYIGTNFVQSISDIASLIKLAILLIIAYIISKIVMKNNKLD